MFSSYDLVIAFSAAILGFVFVPDDRFLAGFLVFLLALVSQKRGWTAE